MRVAFDIAHPRSGTQMMGRMLDTHPEIKWFLEPFRDAKHQSAAWIEQQLDEQAAQPNPPLVVGFGVKYHQLDPWLRVYMHRKPVIHLIRLNTLQTAASAVIAATADAVLPVPVPSTDLMRRAEQISAEIAYWHRFYPKAHIAFYEHVAHSLPVTMLDFLHVSRCWTIKPTIAKEHPSVLEHKVALQ